MTGERIRSARIEKHMTQAQLAEKVGVSRIFMGMIERASEPIMSAKVAKAIAEVLGVSLDFLLCLD